MVAEHNCMASYIAILHTVRTVNIVFVFTLSTWSLHWPAYNPVVWMKTKANCCDQITMQS